MKTIEGNTITCRKLSRPVEKKPNNNKLVKKKIIILYSPLEQKICNFRGLGKSPIGIQEGYKVSRIKVF